MLDDLKYIHEKDAQDALGIAERQWQQLDNELENGNLPKNAKNVKNIVFSGMGGSALAALIAQSWPGFDLPFEINRKYTIPRYVTGNTLFIASSYSGNTEETIESMEQAIKMNAIVAIVSSGGKLLETAKAKSLPYVVLPSGFQPRHATLASLKALISILNSYQLVDDRQLAEIKNSASFVKDIALSWRADKRTKSNEAKQIALEISGKSPVVYAGPLLFPIAYKWKISFNENSKNVAWTNQFPEFNHNEFLGWTSHPIKKPYYIVELTSSLEHDRVQKRVDISNKLLSGKWPHPFEIKAKGDNLLQQMLYLMTLGDFVSIYLAMLNGLNPTPVDLIEKFKKEMNL